MSHRNMPTFKALSLTRSSCDYLSLSINELAFVKVCTMDIGTRRAFSSS